MKNAQNFSDPPRVSPFLYDGLQIHKHNRGKFTLLFMLVGLILGAGCESYQCLQSASNTPEFSGPTGCVKGLQGNVCVANLERPITLVYGTHFNKRTLNIQVEWCPDKNCSSERFDGMGEPIVVTVVRTLHPEEIFYVNCEHPTLNRTVTDVASVAIDGMGTHTSCEFNDYGPAYARWQICETKPPFFPPERVISTRPH